MEKKEKIIIPKYSSEILFFKRYLNVFGHRFWHREKNGTVNVDQKWYRK